MTGNLNISAGGLNVTGGVIADSLTLNGVAVDLSQYLTAVPSTYLLKTDADLAYQLKGTYDIEVPNTYLLKTEAISTYVPKLSLL
jgi:hypothetical protein